MDKRILLFSSDAKTLYKGDVFRALALPMDHTLQFRYPRKYVLGEYRDNPKSLRGRDGVIIFLSGNDTSKPEVERKLERHPIRECLILDAFSDPESEQVILILRLGLFVNCMVEDITDPRSLPPSIFLTETNVSDLRKTGWLVAVKSVEEWFPATLFYQISQVRRGEKVIGPSYSEELRLSQYSLREETDYYIECTYYDCGSNGAPLKIDVSAEAALDVSKLFEFGGGAEGDTKRLPLKTRTLKVRSAPVYMRFHSVVLQGSPPQSECNDPNYVEIHFQLIQNPWKPWQFGALTGVGAFGLLIAQSGFKDSVGNYLDWTNVLWGIVGAVIMGTVAGLLFRLFNKI